MSDRDDSSDDSAAEQAYAALANAMRQRCVHPMDLENTSGSDRDSDSGSDSDMFDDADESSDSSSEAEQEFAALMNALRQANVHLIDLSDNSGGGGGAPAANNARVRPMLLTSPLRQAGVHPIDPNYNPGGGAPWGVNAHVPVIQEEILARFFTGLRAGAATPTVVFHAMLLLLNALVVGAMMVPACFGCELGLERELCASYIKSDLAAATGVLFALATFAMGFLGNLDGRLGPATAVFAYDVYNRWYRRQHVPGLVHVTLVYLGTFACFGMALVGLRRLLAGALGPSRLSRAHVSTVGIGLVLAVAAVACADGVGLVLGTRDGGALRLAGCSLPLAAHADASGWCSGFRSSSAMHNPETWVVAFFAAVMVPAAIAFYVETLMEAVIAKAAVITLTAVYSWARGNPGLGLTLVLVAVLVAAWWQAMQRWSTWARIDVAVSMAMLLSAFVRVALARADAVKIDAGGTPADLGAIFTNFTTTEVMHELSSRPFDPSWDMPAILLSVLVSLGHAFIRAALGGAAAFVSDVLYSLMTCAIMAYRVATTAVYHVVMIAFQAVIVIASAVLLLMITAVKWVGEMVIGIRRVLHV